MDSSPAHSTSSSSVVSPGAVPRFTAQPHLRTSKGEMGAGVEGGWIVAWRKWDNQLGCNPTCSAGTDRRAHLSRALLLLVSRRPGSTFVLPQYGKLTAFGRTGAQKDVGVVSTRPNAAHRA